MFFEEHDFTGGGGDDMFHLSSWTSVNDLSDISPLLTDREEDIVPQSSAQNDTDVGIEVTQGNFLETIQSNGMFRVLSSDLFQSQEETNSLKEELRILKAKSLAYEETIESQATKLKRYEDKIKIQGSVLKQYKMKLKMQSTDLAKAKIKIGESVGETRKLLESAEASYNDSMEASNTVCSPSAKISNSEVRIGVLEAELELLKEEKHFQSTEMSFLSFDVDKKSKELRTVQQECDAKDAEIEALRGQMEDLEQQLADGKEREAVLMRKYTAMKDQAAMMSEEAGRVIEKVKVKSDELIKLNEIVYQLQEQNKSLKAEIKRLMMGGAANETDQIRSMLPEGCDSQASDKLNKSDENEMIHEGSVSFESSQMSTSDGLNELGTAANSHNDKTQDSPRWK